MKSIEPYILNYKKNVLSIPPLKEWAFRTLFCNFKCFLNRFSRKLLYHGLNHITTDEGTSFTPDNVSWATPVTSSK